MRFISQYPGYKYQARVMRQKALGDGGVEVTQEPIYCDFLPVHGGAMLYENELAAALAHFSFNGNTQSEDEATPTDPTTRLSVFDTDEFALANSLSEEDKAEMEERLQQLALEAPSECLMVTDTPIAPPFPNYDTWDGPADKLAARLAEDGHDLPQVLHYERVFGEKRPKVIAALEQAIEEEKEGVVIA